VKYISRRPPYASEFALICGRSKRCDFLCSLIQIGEKANAEVSPEFLRFAAGVFREKTSNEEKRIADIRMEATARDEKIVEDYLADPSADVRGSGNTPLGLETGMAKGKPRA
jgi:hypothetical protein